MTSTSRSGRITRTVLTAAAVAAACAGMVAAPASASTPNYAATVLQHCEGLVHGVDRSGRVAVHSSSGPGDENDLCGSNISVVLTPLPHTPFPAANVNDVNGNGISVGDSRADEDAKSSAVRWTALGAVSRLPLPVGYPDDGSVYSTARGINNSGVGVGMVADDDFGFHSRAVEWSGTNARVLANYGYSTQANAISDTGIVVGTVGIDGVQYAARWKTPDKLVALHTLGGYSGSTASSVNDDGVTVGSAIDASARTRAVRWSKNGVLVALPQLPGAVASSADDINNKGVIAGSVTTADGVQHPAVWDAAGNIRELPTPSSLASCLANTPVGQAPPGPWREEDCWFVDELSINSNGVVAGTYYRVNNVGEYYRWDPVLWTPAA